MMVNGFFVVIQWDIHEIYPAWLWLTVCHGIDGPFVDGLPNLKMGGSFHGYVKKTDGNNYKNSLVDNNSYTNA